MSDLNRRKFLRGSAVAGAAAVGHLQRRQSRMQHL